MPQNRLQIGTTHIGKKANFTSVLRNFDSRLLQVGLLIYISLFSAPKAAFKVFPLQIGFYPSGKGRQTVTQAICHVCNTAPVANGWLSTSILNDSSNSPTLGHSISSWHILYIVCKPFAKGWLVGNFWETVGKKLCFFIVYFDRGLMKGGGFVS